MYGRKHGNDCNSCLPALPRSNNASQKMADPVSKLRLLQELKLAEMLQQVRAKGTLIV